MGEDEVSTEQAHNTEGTGLPVTSDQANLALLFTSFCCLWPLVRISLARLH